MSCSIYPNDDNYDPNMKREMSQSTSVPKQVDLPWKPMLVDRAPSYIRLLHQGSCGALEKYATQRHAGKLRRLD
jgi:hypothetical protein